MPAQMEVRDLMTTDVVTLTEDETLAHAQRCMARGRIRHLPVVRDGKLVGLVTHRDLLAASFSIFHSAGRGGHASRCGIGFTRPDSFEGGTDPPREQVRLSAGGQRAG